MTLLQEVPLGMLYNNISNECLLTSSWSESEIVAFMKQSSAYVVIIMYN